MAGASEPLDSMSSLKLEETLNCPICLEVYTTPKALACLHTFCETCLHAHITKLSETGELNGKIYCPVCRVASPPPDRNKPPSDWARLLPMNYAILPILETVQSKERVSKKIFCGSCSDRDNPAVNFCTDCQMNICGNCVECHKKYKMLQSHTITELGDITNFIVEKSGKQTVGVDFCVEHPYKAIEYFCEEHGVLLCNSCVIISHRLCNKVTGLKEMGQELRKGNDIEKLQTELELVQPVLEGITKALEDNVIQIEEEADALPNRVKELQDKAMKVFDDLYQRVLTQCNNLKKTYTLKVSNEAFNCKSLVAAVESLLITLANVKENGSDIQLFITFHNLEQQMKKYQESLDKMVTDTECTKLKLQIDTTLEQAVSKPSHTANVTAHQFTPDVIAAMKTAVGTKDQNQNQGPVMSVAMLSAAAPEFIPKYAQVQQHPHPQPPIQDGLNEYFERLVSIRPPHLQGVMPAGGGAGGQAPEDMFKDAVFHLTSQPGNMEEYIKPVVDRLKCGVTNPSVLSDIIETLFEQSITEPNFRFTGGKICKYLSNELRSHHVFSGFRGQFLHRCKLEYEKRELLIDTDAPRLCGLSMYFGELFLALEVDLSGHMIKIGILRSSIADLVRLMLTRLDDSLIMCATKLLKERAGTRMFVHVVDEVVNAYTRVVISNNNDALTGTALMETKDTLPGNFDDIFVTIKSLEQHPSLIKTIHCLVNTVLSRHEYNFGVDQKQSPQKPAPSPQSQQSYTPSFQQNEPVFYDRNGQTISREEAGFCEDDGSDFDDNIEEYLQWEAENSENECYPDEGATMDDDMMAAYEQFLREAEKSRRH